MSKVSLPQVEKPTVDVAALRAALTEAITGEVRFERLDRALYSTDASVYQIVPLGVVLPKSREDVIATLKVCARFGVPITARGGGTSQAGQSIGAGVILDFSKYCNRILEVNTAERWVRVEPGSVLDDLNQHVKPHGLQFPVDISTANRATIGGMVANNSSGTHSIIFGKTIDHVLELKVLLADGSIIDTRTDANHAGFDVVRRLAAEHADEIDRRYPKILRRVGGYNLDAFAARGAAGPTALLQAAELVADSLRESIGTRGASAPPTMRQAALFVGSEGTLGIVLEAKLRLVELPRAKAVCVVQFADLLDALAATPIILTHRPAAVEVMDRRILDCTKLNPEASRLRDFLDGDPGAILIVEFYGDDAAELPARVDALEASLRTLNGVAAHHRATDAAAQARIWKLRTLALGLSMAEKGDAKAISFVEDTAVAPDRLRDYIAEFLGVVARHGTTAAVYAHASVGCLHVRPVIDLKTVDGVQRFQAIADDIADLVLKYGGALSGEHGDGLVRSPYQEKMYGPVLYQAFRAIKRAFDPHNLLNPGKIVDAPPLASNLRYGPAYQTPDVPTTFDFSADGGVARAAELCAGVGECRKKRGGTMCPSYQATCDEQHSTRGRANTLRLALTGHLELGGLTDPAVLEALDLCLECKACKSECPTNVDMARLKAEVVDQHHKKHGLPWRNWLFGNVATLSAWGCALAPMSNWWAQSDLGRWVNEKAFGIDRRRRPPRFVRKAMFTLNEIWSGNEAKMPSVSLFPDTFVKYHESNVAPSVAQLLQRVNHVNTLGVVPKDGLNRYRVVSPRCCGRPMISNGMLDAAIANASFEVELLSIGKEPIIACEPSCILTIRDDYPALLKGEMREKAKAVAARCFTFEEFLEKRLCELNISSTLTPGPSPGGRGGTVQFRAGPKRILVQGHCHQRALVGMTPTLNLLKRIPGAEVIDLDAGCCGMAGSFGYEKEHYEISRLVGEQRLFPAIRAADADTVIVAPGFSCRLQIEHFTGRKAVHPATLLQSLLVKS